MIRFASLGSGSAGNALLVERGSTCLMVDCGFGIGEAVARLARLGYEAASLDGILVTHEHGDHLGGVFRLARRFGLPVWMTHGTWSACRESAQRVDVQVIDSQRSFRCGDLEIQPFPVPHDAREPVQYLFSGNGRRLGVLTDIGEITPHVQDLLSGVEGLVLEFNHDAELLRQSRYPVSLKRRIAGRYGHLDNAAAAKLLSDICCDNLQHLVAAHLSEQNNRPDLVLQRIGAVLESPDCTVHVATQGSGFGWREIS